MIMKENKIKTSLWTQLYSSSMDPIGLSHRVHVPMGH